MQPVLSKLKNLRLEYWILGALLLGSCGCANFVDMITDREFKIKDLWSPPPDPLKVLAESTDGAKRGAALARLKDPLLHGGTQELHDKYLEILITAATKNPPPKSGDPRSPYPPNTDPDCLEPMVRLGAIRALGDYKDPKAAQALKAVYVGYSDQGPNPLSTPQGSLPFMPDVNSHIKIQALAALEKTGSPIARDLFLIVAASPGPGRKNADIDQSETNDERLAALRGLARFRDREVLVTLTNVLAAEKKGNVAVRDRAHEVLVAITGKHLPQDAEAWRNLIQNSDKNAFDHEPGVFQRFLGFMAH